MSRSISSELKNSYTASNNSIDRKTSSNEQYSGLRTLYPGRVQDSKPSVKTSEGTISRKTSNDEQKSALITLDTGRKQDIEASAENSESSKFPKNQSNATSNRSEDSIKIHQSSGMENDLELGVTQVFDKLPGFVSAVRATQLSFKSCAPSHSRRNPSQTSKNVSMGLVGTDKSTNSTNKNSKTKATKEVENEAGLVRTIRATQISSKADKDPTAHKPTEAELVKSNNPGSMPQANLAPGFGGGMMIMSRPGQMPEFSRKKTTQTSSKTSKSNQLSNRQSQLATK